MPENRYSSDDCCQQLLQRLERLWSAQVMANRTETQLRHCIDQQWPPKVEAIWRADADKYLKVRNLEYKEAALAWEVFARALAKAGINQRGNPVDDLLSRLDGIAEQGPDSLRDAVRRTMAWVKEVGRELEAAGSTAFGESTEGSDPGHPSTLPPCVEKAWGQYREILGRCPELSNKKMAEIHRAVQSRARQMSEADEVAGAEAWARYIRQAKRYYEKADKNG